jgi:hypothetical protein
VPGGEQSFERLRIAKISSFGQRSIERCHIVYVAESEMG